MYQKQKKNSQMVTTISCFNISILFSHGLSITRTLILLRKHMKVHGKEAVCQFDSSESDEEEESSAASPSSSLVSAPPSYIRATSPSSSSHGQGVPASQADWYFWIYITWYLWKVLPLPNSSWQCAGTATRTPSPPLPPTTPLHTPCSTPRYWNSWKGSVNIPLQKSEKRLIWRILMLKTRQRILYKSVNNNICFEDWLSFFVSGQIWGPPAQHRGDYRECLLTRTSLL